MEPTFGSWKNAFKATENIFNLSVTFTPRISYREVRVTQWGGGGGSHCLPGA